MTSIFLVDGAKYELWTPKKEAEFEEIVKEHSKQIFGKDSLYFDIKKKIAAKSGVEASPDGYLIDFSDDTLYIVEVELSKHRAHKHIVTQLSKFMSIIKEQKPRKEIVDMLYSAIKGDVFKEAFVKNKLGSKDIYHFLSRIISKDPEVMIIIEELSDKVEEACKNLKVEPDIIELKTFMREGVGIRVHTHLINLPWEEEEEEESHAFWNDKEKAFECGLGKKKACQYYFEAPEIVEHLKDEHDIDPDDQIIDGWTPKHQRIYERSLKKAKY